MDNMYQLLYQQVMQYRNKFLLSLHLQNWQNIFTLLISYKQPCKVD